MVRRPLIKQFHELTAPDFSGHMIWVQVHSADGGRPWCEEVDALAFRPWSGELPVRPRHAYYLVSAVFRLADGRMSPGFVTPQAVDDPQGEVVCDLDAMRPHMLREGGGPIPFWLGRTEPDPRLLDLFYAEFVGTRARVFPIVFSAQPGVSYGVTSGRINGFSWVKTGMFGKPKVAAVC